MSDVVAKDVVVLANQAASEEDGTKELESYLQDDPKIEFELLSTYPPDDESIKELGKEKAEEAGLLLDVENPNIKIDKDVRNKIKAYVLKNKKELINLNSVDAKVYYEVFFKGDVVQAEDVRQLAQQIRKLLNKPVDMSKGIGYNAKGEPIPLDQKYPPKPTSDTEQTHFSSRELFIKTQGGLAAWSATMFKQMNIPKLDLRYDPNNPDESWLEYDGELYDLKSIMKELFGFEGGWEEYKKINKEDLTRKRETLKDGTVVGPSVRAIHTAFAFKEFSDNFDPADYKAIAYILPSIEPTQLSAVKAYSCQPPTDQEILNMIKTGKIYSVGTSVSDQAKIDSFKKEIKETCPGVIFKDFPADVYKTYAQRMALLSDSVDGGSILKTALSSPREQRGKNKVKASKGFIKTIQAAWTKLLRVGDAGEKLATLEVLDSSGKPFYVKKQEVEGGTIVNPVRKSTEGASKFFFNQGESAVSGLPLATAVLGGRVQVACLPRNGKYLTDAEERLFDRLGIRTDMQVAYLGPGMTKYDTSHTEGRHGAWIDLNKVGDGVKSLLHPRGGPAPEPAPEEEETDASGSPEEQEAAAAEAEANLDDAMADRLKEPRIAKQVTEINQYYNKRFEDLDSIHGNLWFERGKNKKANQLSGFQSIFNAISLWSVGDPSEAEMLKNTPKGNPNYAIRGGVRATKKWGAARYAEIKDVAEDTLLLYDENNQGMVVSWAMIYSLITEVIGNMKNKIRLHVDDQKNKPDDVDAVLDWYGGGEIIVPLEKSKNFVKDIMDKLENENDTLVTQAEKQKEKQPVKENNVKIFNMINELIDECINEFQSR